MFAQQGMSVEPCEQEPQQENQQHVDAHDPGDQVVGGVVALGVVGDQRGQPDRGQGNLHVDDTSQPAPGMAEALPGGAPERGLAGGLGLCHNFSRCMRPESPS